MAEATDNYLAEQEAAQRMEAERNQARLLAQQQAEAAALADQRRAALQKQKGGAGSAKKALAQAFTLLLQLALRAENTILFALGVAYINLHLLMGKFMPEIFVPLGKESSMKKGKGMSGGGGNQAMQKMQEKIAAVKDNAVHWAETGCCCFILIIILLITSLVVAVFDPSTNGIFGIFEDLF
jgi:multidrug efflux pump subunit AcrA (membrane-fusion protein)